MKNLSGKLPIIISGIVAILLLVYAYGCQPTTKSLRDPAQKVTREELSYEVETLLSESRLRIADLDRQQELRNLIFQQTLVIAESGTVNPVGVITALLAIMGVGATVDDVRLRKKQKKDLPE